MSGLALVAAAGILLAGLAAAIALGRLRTVHARLIGLTLVVGALPILAVLLTGIAMFHMGADAVLIAVAVASAIVAIGGAWLVTRSISRPLRDLRASTTRLAGGDFATRVSVTGPAELSEVARAFNEMAGRLEELFDARRELVAWASHDLRAPLSSLQAMLEAVEDGVVEPEHYLPAMRDQVRRLTTLIDDLFELARIDADGDAPETVDVPVDRLVGTSVDGFAAEASRARDRARAPRPRRAAGRRGRAGGDRARHAEPARERPPPHAARRIDHGGGRACERDCDRVGRGHRRGLPPGAARAMFDRFWRADPARDRSADGAGLGLAIAKGLVERHGGRIWAEERAGGGAKVAFTLPAA